MTSGGGVRVVRIYHGGRSPAHRARERALKQAGVEVTLIVPSAWPEGGGERRLDAEDFPVVELPTTRPDDVNRHRYLDTEALQAAILAAHPDVVDVHEEPFSAVSHQLVQALPGQLPMVMYSAQN